MRTTVASPGSAVTAKPMERASRSMASFVARTTPTASRTPVVCACSSSVTEKPTAETLALPRVGEHERYLRTESRRVDDITADANELLVTVAQGGDGEGHVVAIVDVRHGGDPFRRHLDATTQHALVARFKGKAQRRTLARARHRRDGSGARAAIHPRRASRFGTGVPDSSSSRRKTIGRVARA